MSNAPFPGPTWDIDAPARAPGHSDLPRGYKSAFPIGRGLRVAVVGVQVLCLGALLGLAGLVPDVDFGDAVAILLAIVLVATFGLAILLGLLWSYVVARNARLFGSTNRWIRKWSILAWLVPLAHAVVPYYLMAAVWEASTPKSSRHAKLWFAFWVFPIFNIFGIVVTYAVLGMGIVYLSLISIIICGSLFRRMSAALEQFQDSWSPPALGAPTPVAKPSL